MDPYTLLGVSRNASLDEIKKAYRKKAFATHPDRSKAPDAEKLFKEVNEAYSILSNPLRKRDYDEKGTTNRRYYQAPPPPRPKPRQKPKPKKEPVNRDIKDGKPYGYQDEPDIDCYFFGGSSSIGRNILLRVKVTPEELKGCTKKIKVKKREWCGNCRGRGNISFCKKCNRKGEMSFCQFCNSPENFNVEKCEHCHGSCYSGWSIKEIEIKIPPNSKLGHQIIVFGEGDIQGADNNFHGAGNLYVVLLS